MGSEAQGLLNRLADVIRLEVSEAKLALEREDPNVPFALHRLEDILAEVNKLATTRDRWAS